MTNLSKIEEIYHCALELPAEERLSFVEASCGGDEELFGEVMSLINLDLDAENFIESPPDDVAAGVMTSLDSKSDIVGKLLDKYRVIGRIAAGGMGEVYLAEDTKLERKVALKILPPQFSSDHERQLRFEQEAKAISSLNHRNIITIYDIEEVNGISFIATEYVDGETLRDRIARSSLTWQDAVGFAIQIAAALSAAHSVGIIHRDIKPANVMIREDGDVKVLDFGLAKLTTPTGQSGSFDTRDHTAQTRVMGTINYMSPEQALGEHLNERTDIFSLGVVLYEMVSGKQPFAGASEAAVYNSTINHAPPHLRTCNPNIPAELDRIVSRAMEKEPNKRYQSSAELHADLESLRNDPDAFRGEADRTVSKPKQTQAWLPKAMVAALAFATIVAGLAGWLLVLPSTNRSKIKSIAVLPFESKSSDTDVEYVSDGLAESLIYRIAQIPELKVSPTTSVFRYKGKQAEFKAIAADLGVDAILTGRIQQRGDRLSINAELVDIKSNKTLWGRQYERNLSDLLSIQRDITSEIVRSLELKLSGETEQLFSKKYSENNEAYQLYLKARFLYARRKKEDIFKAIEYFQRAVELDSRFALAEVGIADCYNTLPTYAYLSTMEAIPLAKAAATRALALDPTLAEAHAALAFSLSIGDLDWAGAEKEYLRALELDPNSSEIHFHYGLDYLIPTGRTKEAVEEIKKALDLEPLSLPVAATLAGAYMIDRQDDKALEQARKVYDLEPNFVGGRVWLAGVYADIGRYEEALVLCEESLRSTPNNQPFLRFQGYVYAKMGRRAEAERVIENLRETSRTQYVSVYYIASIYAALGDIDRAFDELERSFANRDYLLIRLKADNFIENLRGDRRFENLVDRLGLKAK